MARFRHVEDIFRDSCLQWGYQEVKTPTLEYMHLFTSTGTLTPGKLGKVYSFLDWDGWSGERVVLRPDCTIPVARAYIESKQGRSDPAKLFYVMNVFGFEQTGTESRERWQCGAEFVGGKSPLADAELMSMASEVLKSLRIGTVKLKLSHVGVLREVLKGMPVDEHFGGEVLDRLLDGDPDALSGIAARDGERAKLATLLLANKGRSAEFLKNCRATCGPGLEGASGELDAFIAVAEVLDSLGCSYEIDMSSARGFEYYTGVTFQLYCGDHQVGAGGRYDALVPLMEGGNIPSCGFALSLDRVIALLQVGVAVRSTWKGVLIEPGDSVEAIKAAFDIAQTLREAGFVADVDLPDARPNPWAWTLVVRPPDFTLWGPDGKLSRASTIGEVISLMEAKWRR
jgi:histidyl-tRNA synthetase